MNRFPRLDTKPLPSSHSPFLHFDLITRPPFSPFFLSFSLSFSSRSTNVERSPLFFSSFARFAPDSGSFHSLSALSRSEKRTERRTNCWSTHLVRPREREPPSSPSGHRKTWKTCFRRKSIRVALLTRRIYTIKSFVPLHLVFPGKNSVSLFLREALCPREREDRWLCSRGREEFVVAFLDDFLERTKRNVFGWGSFVRTIVCSRTRISNIHEHPSTIPLRNSSDPRNQRKRKRHLYGTFLFLPSKEYSSIKVLEKWLRNRIYIL